MKNSFARPFRDVTHGISVCIDRFGMLAMPAMLGAMLLSWWVYVPIHELFHAWGCLLAGGSVSRLEIDSSYGGEWVALLVPYVVPASGYAGRLSGFDTHGNDGIYLATVFAPYVLTLLVGLPLLRLAQRTANPLILGASVPLAYSPFISLTGDYYELGSIVMSRLVAPWWPQALLQWRSDDLPKLVVALFGSGARNGMIVDALGVAGSLGLGTLLAFGTYQAGAWIADRMMIGSGDASPSSRQGTDV
jgi:hypothetical protein